jgi:hypothetical protein
MAKKVVGLEVTVDTPQADASVKSLRAQLKEAQADVANLSEKFGQTSKEAQEAAKKAASLKDSIGDAKDLVDAFNPDAKFKAFGQAVNGVTGGFAALEGAIGLFGTKSEAVEQTLVKVQSALALSQGVDQVLESVDAFERFGDIIKTKVITAFTTLRGAVIATGIGALVVGVGLLIANFDSLKNSSGIVGRAIRFVGDIISDTIEMVQKFTDFIGLTSIAEEEAAERTKKAAERTKKVKEEVYEAELKIAQATGKGVEEIEKKKRDEILATIRLQSKAVEFALNNPVLKRVLGGEFLKDAKANIDSQLLKLETEQKVADINANKKNEERSKTNAAARKSEADAAKKSREDELKLEQQLAEELRREKLKGYQLEFDDIRLQYEKRVELANGNKDLLIEIEKSKNTQIEELRAKYNIKAQGDGENTVKLQGMVIGAVNSVTQIGLDARSAIETQSAKDREKLEADEVARKKSNAEAVSQIASNLTQALGKDTVAGKAVAVAEATINTYLAASKALTGIKKGNPLGAILAITQAAAVIATGIKSVKAIVATKVPGTSSGSAASIPSVSNITAQVAAPLEPQADTTQLNQASINAVGNASSRAYVLDSDITNNRDRITRLNRAARIN